MAQEIKTRLDLQDIKRIKRVIRNKRALLKNIGALLVEESQKAFEEKKFGGIGWARQYPSQEEPFLHIAGALSDLNETGKVKSKRFTRQPALIDRGTLKMSINSQIVDENSVEVGSRLPYASIHQIGGISEIVIKDSARKALVKLLSQKRRKGSKKSGEQQALKKLRFILHEDKLKTKVHKRPFVGFTDQSSKRIPKLIEEFYSTEANK